MIRRRRPKVTSKILLFAGLLFLSVGLLAAFFTAGTMTYGYMKAASWTAVPAQIDTLEYKISYGDSTTYNVEAKYRYVVDGQEYTNTRVALSTGYDNVGTFWYDLHRKLKREKQRDDVYAWVDLDNPQNALLDRSFRWRMVVFGSIFLIMFGMFGVGMIWGAFLPEKTKEDRKAEARSGIKSDEASSYKFIFYFGLLFFLAGSGFTALIIPDVLKGQNLAALLVLLFPVVGALIMAFAWRSKRSYQLIGETLLFPDPVIGAIGGQTGGHFEINSRTDGSPVTMRLTCSESRKSGDDTYTSIIWQDTTTAYAKSIVDGSRVHFVFDVPAELPEEGKSGKHRSVDWELSCDAKLEINGETVPMTRTWEIPMEKSTRTSRAMAYVPSHFSRTVVAREEEAAQESAADQIPIEDLGGDISITSASARDLKLTIPFAGVGLLFAGIGYFLIDEWFGGYFFLILGLGFAIPSLFTMGRRLNVLVNTTDKIIFMGRSWFFISLYTRRLTYSDPSEFSIVETSSSSSDKIQTVYYALYAERDGKKLKLAEGVQGERAAEALLAAVKEKLFG